MRGRKPDNFPEVYSWNKALLIMTSNSEIISISRTEIAHILNMSQRTIDTLRYEKRNPSVEVQLKIKHLYQIYLDMLTLWHTEKRKTRQY